MHQLIYSLDFNGIKFLPDYFVNYMVDQKHAKAFDGVDLVQQIDIPVS